MVMLLLISLFFSVHHLYIAIPFVLYCSSSMSRLAFILAFSATHMTLNESDTPESITWPHFKSLNAHFSVHYLDNKDQHLFRVSE